MGLVMWRCHVVVVVGVVGDGGDEVVVADGGGQERKTLFVYDVYASFRQTPLTQLSKRQRGHLHDLLRKHF